LLICIICLALTSGDLSCEQTTVIKMKTNKDPEVQLIKTTEGRGPEDFPLANPEDFKGTIEGKFSNWGCSYDR
jgi:hypothetical protein